MTNRRGQAGYLLAISGGDAGWDATQDFRLPQEVIGATLQTPVFYQDHLSGIRPSGELISERNEATHP